MTRFIKLSLSAVLLTSSAFALNLKKIEETPTGQVIERGNKTVQVDSDTSKVKSNSMSEAKYEKPKKLKLKRYPVKYDKSLANFSIIPHDKKAFKKYMAENDIEKFTLKRIFGTTDSNIAIMVSAYGYDWIYKRADLAENFYLLERELPKISLIEKLRMADYYLRTSRPEEIPNLIKKSDCMSSFKYNSMCFYYLGVSDYLLTGNNKNVFLRIAKNKQKKAMEIYKK